MNKLGAGIARYFRSTDKLLLFFWLLASALSILFLSGLRSSSFASDMTVRTQGTATLLGMGAALVISLFDYRMLLKLWKLYLPACLVLVALTFTGLGTVRGDNQAWLLFAVGGRELSIQPSEFLKISCIVTLSLHIVKVREHLNRPATVGLLAAHGCGYALLIQLQNDTGSALIFLAIFCVMLFSAGLAWRYIAAAVAAAGAAAPILWLHVLSDDQKMRILILRDPGLDVDYAFQQGRAMSAFGYGGVQGTGIFAGEHIRVPEAYNDFIFSFVGEACGFIGCLGVIALLCAIAFKVFYNSCRVDDDAGRFVCVGVFAMIVAQMLVNIGMCLGLLPVIGVTLPLFSSGGSSVLSLYLALGMVLSVYTHRTAELFHE